MKQNSKVGMEIMERVAEIYYNRLNSSRAMITNLFKMFKFLTGKSKFIETYYERKTLEQRGYNHGKK